PSIMAYSSDERTELQKMIAGDLYDPLDPELVEKRTLARQIMADLARIPYGNLSEKRAIYREFFGEAGEDLFIEPPFYCDYGFNIFWGRKSYANFNCVFLDCAPIHIGDRVFMAPSVHLYT